MTALSSIELFAGAGGLAQGVTRAGFHPRLVVEWNRDACRSLRENQQRGFPLVQGWPVQEADVRLTDFTAFQGVDLVSGGPPCQPFSIGGKHAAQADGRDMFPEAVRAVRETQPRAFVFENVKGLTRATFRNYFEYVRLQLQHPDLVARQGEDWGEHLARLEQHHLSGDCSGLSYRVLTEVLQAADYGVPQKRERIFFVGFRQDLNVNWHFPAPTHSKIRLLQEQANGIYWERHDLPNPLSSKPTRAHSLFEEDSPQPWVTVRDALTGLPDPECAQDVPNHVFVPGARVYPGHTGSPLDLPSKTLKAGDHGVPGGENMMVKDDGSVRYFTVREAARLQTFSDSYVLSGAWGEAMRQLGNAVPVRLAEVLLRSVADALR